MITIKFNFIKNFLFQNNTVSEKENYENNKKNKRNSLAYLAYKNRKKKGLIDNQEECPTIYFGDEWAF